MLRRWGRYADLFGWEINARDGAGWVQARDPDGGVGLNFQAQVAYEPPTWPEEHGLQAKMITSRFSWRTSKLPSNGCCDAEVPKPRINQMIATERGSG